ncbi:MAG: undecaprenyl-diphosphate phosphatase [Clostridia bacterium]|nr:undecaprenyl-diphosphate phosphatase [Clostridia bacterium]
MNFLFEALKALLFGIVEGITEWLPISSTGHMILLNELVNLKASENFMNMFNVVIQLGAVLAVILLLFRKIWPFTMPGKGEGIGGIFRMDVIRLWLLVVVAILPSSIVGIPLDDWLDAHLHNNVVIAIMLVVYGVLFIAVERSTVVRRSPRVARLEEMDVRTALLIGLFQVLALIPGTSRSGATILGGLLVGCSRAVSAEFSFIMAIPTMAGASLLKLLKFGFNFTTEELVILVVGCVTAFLVSMLAVRTFIGYIKKHSFEPFGWYRIILGLLVAIMTVVKSI